MLKKKEKTIDAKQLLQEVQERMTPEPIPKELLPEIIKRFLVFYDQPHEKESMDAFYICEQLYPEWMYFIEKSPEIMKNLEQQENILEAFFDKECKGELTKIKLKYQINVENREVARQFAILYPFFNKVRLNLSSTRFAIVKQRKLILKALFSLCEELIKHPRYVHLKLYTILQNWQNLETDMIPSSFIKHQALKYKLKDLESQLKFIPNSFINEEQNKELLKHIVTSCVVMCDPQSGYLPEIDECFSLGCLLKSEKSPINLKDEILCDMTPEFTYSLLHKITTHLCDYIGLKQDKINEIKGLDSICTRFLFDELMLINLNQKINQTFMHKMSEMNSKTLQELGFTAEYIPKDYFSGSKAKK